MSRSKRETLEMHIAKSIGNSRYIVVINGIFQRSSKHILRVKVVDNRLVYFISRSSGGTRMDDPLPEMNEKISSLMNTGELFGFNFSNWLHNRYTDSRLPWNINANTVTNVLFMESPMYHLFKINYPKHGNLQARFQVETNEGSELDLAQRTQLMTDFRINGFRSIRDIMQFNYANRINRKSPPFYKATSAFFIGMMRTEDLFNPFYDDKLINDYIKDRQLFQLMDQRMSTLADTRIEYSRLSLNQVSHGLGLKVNVPMDFDIFFSLLVGFVMTEIDTPVDFPHKLVAAYRLQTSVAGFTPVLSEEEWLNLDTSEEQSYYVRTTSYNAFLLRHLRHFTNNGMRATNVLSTFAEAILV